MTGSLVVIVVSVTTTNQTVSRHLLNNKTRYKVGCFVAEKQGFEPWLPLEVHTH